MIRSVRFQGLRSLADAELLLGDSGQRMTVIVGANGSGKSTALWAIEAMAKAAGAYLDGAVRPSEGVFVPGHVGTPEYQSALESLRTRGADRDGVLDVTAELNPGPPLVVSIDSARESVGPERRGSGIAGGTAMPALRMQLSGWIALSRARTLRLRAEAIRRPSNPAVVDPRVAFDGAEVPTVLLWLAGNDPDAKQRIVESVRRVVPRFAGLRTPTLDTREGVRVTFVARFDDQGDVPAEHLSEGTLFTIALATILHAPPMPELLLIDDIEHGLHPRAQASLMDVLKSALEERPSLQLVVTTHSPFVVGCVAPEALQVFALDEHGHTQIRPLTAHPEFERWKGQFDAGEFWSFVGEDWAVRVAAE